MWKTNLINRINDDEIFKVTSVPFFIPEFNLISCTLDNFTLKALYQIILY